MVYVPPTKRGVNATKKTKGTRVNTLGSAVPMAPPRTPPPAGPLPYTYEAATKEIQRYLDRMPRGTQKQLAAACGIESQSFSHRMTQYRGERFTVEHFAAICREANAPTAWPFVKWEKGEAFDSFQKLLASHKHT